MEVRTTTFPDRGTVIFRLNGELDLYSSPDFRDLAVAKMDEGFTEVLLHMSGCTYLDSSGVGVLIRLLQTAGGSGGSVGVIGLQGAPLRVLQMSNLLSLVKTYSDEPSALARSIRDSPC